MIFSGDLKSFPKRLRKSTEEKKMNSRQKDIKIFLPAAFIHVSQII